VATALLSSTFWSCTCAGTLNTMLQALSPTRCSKQSRTEEYRLSYLFNCFCIYFIVYSRYSEGGKLLLFYLLIYVSHVSFALIFLFLFIFISYMECHCCIYVSVCYSLFYFISDFLFCFWELIWKRHSKK